MFLFHLLAKLLYGSDYEKHLKNKPIRRGRKR